MKCCCAVEEQAGQRQESLGPSEQQRGLQRVAQHPHQLQRQRGVGGPDGLGSARRRRARRRAWRGARHREEAKALRHGASIARAEHRRGHDANQRAVAIAASNRVGRSARPSERARRAP